MSDECHLVERLRKEAHSMLNRPNPMTLGNLLNNAADEIERLRSLVSSLSDRVAQQSELLSRRAEGGAR